MKLGSIRQTFGNIESARDTYRDFFSILGACSTEAWHRISRADDGFPEVERCKAALMLARSGEAQLDRAIIGAQ